MKSSIAKILFFYFVFTQLLNDLTFGQTPAGNNTAIQFNNNGSFGGSPYLQWNGYDLKLQKTGTKSARIYFNSEALDESWIFSENYEQTKNRLVVQTGDDGDDDYIVFRNKLWSVGDKDVFEIHRGWVLANSNFIANGDIRTNTTTTYLWGASSNQNQALMFAGWGVAHGGIFWKGDTRTFTVSTGNNNTSLGHYGDANLLVTGNIHTNGKVGIGTTSPNHLLEIYSSNVPTLAIGKLNNETGGQSRLVFYAGTSSAPAGFNGFSIVYNKSGYTDRLSFIDGGHDENLTILSNGNIGIGTTAPDAKLTVKGTIHAEEVKVDLNVPGPDYVFETDYPLASLEETKAYIDQHKHLPGIPSSADMQQNGVNLLEMNMKLLEKVEELTLHLIELEQGKNQLLEENKKILSRLEKLEKQ